MNVNVLRSESTGSVHVKSADPAEPPAIRFNFLSARADRDGLLAAIRKGRELMATSPLKELTGEEIAPGANLKTDEEILDWVRNNAETTYHPVGTCKMGADPMAVVDHELRVHGLQGLRVADASIMPTLTSGNTNAPCIMIGEKCAEMVLAAAAARSAQGRRRRGKDLTPEGGFLHEYFAGRTRASGGDGNDVALAVDRIALRVVALADRRTVVRQGSIDGRLGNRHRRHAPVGILALRVLPLRTGAVKGLGGAGERKRTQDQESRQTGAGKHGFLCWRLWMPPARSTRSAPRKLPAIRA